MESPLTKLCKVLKIVKESAASYRDQLQKNEAVTRAVLVDPVLRALGWDIANPGRVEVERIVQGGAVDYYLNAKSPVVVEAKKLGEPLDKHYVQIIKYACILRIENLFLTDGLKWIHYTNVSASNQKPSRIIDLEKIGEEDLAEVAAYLVQALDAELLAPEQQIVDELKQKIDMLGQVCDELSKKIVEIQNHVMPYGVIDHNAASAQSTLSWLVLGESWDAKNKRPAKLRLPDDQISTFAPPELVRTH